MTLSARSLRQRGFTLIEVMLVLAIIGCLSILCIPLFQRFAARARKAEMYNVLGKMELNFRNNFESTGVYGPDTAGTGLPFNPPQPPGSGAASWDSTIPEWKTFPFPFDGPLYLRYSYTISGGGTILKLQVKGSFLGIPNWTYDQTYQDGNAPASEPVELPIRI